MCGGATIYAVLNEAFKLLQKYIDELRHDSTEKPLYSIRAAIAKLRKPQLFFFNNNTIIIIIIIIIIKFQQQRNDRVYYEVTTSVSTVSRLYRGSKVNVLHGM